MRTVYAGSPNDASRGRDALVVGALKWIALPRGGGALYELAVDPAETRDVAGRRLADAERLTRRAETVAAANEALRLRRLAKRGAGQLEAVRHETRRQLEALGYVK